MGWDGCYEVRGGIRLAEIRRLDELYRHPVMERSVSNLLKEPWPRLDALGHGQLVISSTWSAITLLSARIDSLSVPVLQRIGDSLSRDGHDPTHPASGGNIAGAFRKRQGSTINSSTYEKKELRWITRRSC